MAVNKKVVLFGAGVIGKKALLYFGQNQVAFFVDNNAEKKFFYGKRVLSFSEFLSYYQDDKDIIIYITVSRRNFETVTAQLNEAGFHDVLAWGDAVSQDDFDSNPRLAKFKNCYQGRRAFIIGTGPSLTLADLNTLHLNNEICFASNKIYKIFSEIDWRPSVYAAYDDLVLRNNINEILQLELDPILVNPCDNILDFPMEYDRDNVYYCNCIVGRDNVQFPPGFSSDPSRCIFADHTITYALLQWAFYMGVKEVYLLGIDHNYNRQDGSHNANHFIPNYVTPGETYNRPRDTYYINATLAYEIANTYAEKNGFRVYNATRGGALEVFPRVDFDSLF